LVFKGQTCFVTIIFQGLNSQEKLKPSSTQREKYTIGDEGNVAYSESAVHHGLIALVNHILFTESIFLAFSKSHALARSGRIAPISARPAYEDRVFGYLLAGQKGIPRVVPQN